MTIRKSDERASLRREMMRVSEKLCGKDDLSALGLALRAFLPTMHRAFVLRCVPEQAEDIYWLLVSPTEIVKAEIPRDLASDEKPVMLLMDVNEFRRNRPSRQTRERLALALELAKASGSNPAATASRM